MPKVIFAEDESFKHIHVLNSVHGRTDAYIHKCINPKQDEHIHFPVSAWKTRITAISEKKNEIHRSTENMMEPFKFVLP